MAQKKWSQLSDSTKKRYKRNGVTPQQYNAGKITPERKQEIYGKRKTSWAIEVAKQRGLESQFARDPEAFNKLSLEEKGKLADEFSIGHTSHLSPLQEWDRTKNGKWYPRFSMKGPDKDYLLTEVDENEFLDPNGYYPNKHFGHTLRTEAQFNAVHRFEEYMSDLYGEDWEFDWESFRSAYKTGI